MKNPFQPHYDLCNAGNSKEKLASLPEFPHIIDIEMTNTCNFRCLMCPTGNYSQRRKSGFMDREVYYRILDQLAERKTPLRFIRWGEPLSHPDILEFISAATEHGIITHLNTNGSNLDRHRIEDIIATGLSSLKFSFQGADRGSYAEMRNIDFYDELVEIIKLFHDIRGDRTFPYLALSTTVTNETPEMIENFRRTISPYVDKLDIGKTLLDFIDLNAVRLRPHEVEMLKKLKKQESVDKVHPECPEVFDKLAINWNGEVTACCMDSDNIMVVGDARTDSLIDIWNSPKLNEYRRILADMRHDDLPLCANCYETHGFHAKAPGQAGNGKSESAEAPTTT